MKNPNEFNTTLNAVVKDVGLMKNLCQTDLVETLRKKIDWAAFDKIESLSYANPFDDEFTAIYGFQYQEEIEMRKGIVLLHNAPLSTPKISLPLHASHNFSGVLLDYFDNYKKSTFPDLVILLLCHHSAIYALPIVAERKVWEGGELKANYDSIMYSMLNFSIGSHNEKKEQAIEKLAQLFSEKSGYSIDTIANNLTNEINHRMTKKRI